MAYAGYRIKINGEIFPNIYMARGSYNMTKNPRLCESYVDALGVSHDVFYPTAKAIINFSIKPHSTDEHHLLREYFNERENVSVEYFDDNSETYLTGTFKVKNFTWKDDNATSGSVDYSATDIQLEEY